MKFNSPYLILFFFCSALLYTPLIFLENGDREYCRIKINADVGDGKSYYTGRWATRMPDTFIHNNNVLTELDYFIGSTF